MPVVDDRALLRSVRTSPGIHFHGLEPTFGTVTTYIDGLDAGSGHQLLEGFREYLVLRADGGDHLWWTSLVLTLTLGSTARPETTADDQLATDGLFDLLDRFLGLVGSSRSRRDEVKREHLLWLQRQSWFDIDRQRFGSSPPGELLDLTQAADLLGLSVEQLVELIYTNAVRSGWVGAEVLLRRDEVLRYRSATTTPGT